MSVNGEAIYGTRPIAPYRDGNVRLTRKRDGTVYAIYIADTSEVHPPSKIRLSTLHPEAGATVTMLGLKGTLHWEKDGKGVAVDIPASAQQKAPCRYAWTIKISRGGE